MKEFLAPFCTVNTGSVVQSNNDIYIVSALGSFSGSFGTISLAPEQSLNPSFPIKFESPVSGDAGTLFYYFT